MSTAPTPGAPEKQAVRSMFDRIAPRYDFLNRVLSAGIDRRWRRMAVDLLELPPKGRVLDFCTGTADLLLEALTREPESRGIGIDLSTEMLARGAQKLAGQGVAGRGRLVAGDAERLPFRSAMFDGAIVAFGIRNVGDPPSALREVARVLRPGSRLVVLEFGRPAGPLGPFYRFYFSRVLPFVGGVLSGDRGAYAYLPASVERFPGPERFAEMLRTAGFTTARWQALSFGIAHAYVATL